ncbi:PhzF family phenazine biosynthesis isomerase [Kitasatospora sp. NPDC127111]|uniref:PhzF family phenazine biosynthesis isomerase n=1 Tax=Kitasatospora sp. NPDC127111 TaxID=3345363 RepID=UPI00362508AD
MSRRTAAFTVVDACLRDGRGGSPTAVVDEPDGAPLTDDERRAVPALAGTSHAVFLSGGRSAPAVRFFTAAGELPACGHGTVAALAYLAERAGGPEHRATLRAAGHDLVGRTVRAASGHRVALTTGPVGLREPTAAELALLLPALGIPADALAPGAGVATLGRPRLLVPVATPSALAALAPAAERLRAACDRLGLLGCYVHTPPSVAGRVAARMFAPSIGVPEDIANANSTACLAAHLFTRQGTTRLTVDLGDALAAPATIATRARPVPSGLPGPVRVELTATARVRPGPR